MSIDAKGLVARTDIVSVVGSYTHLKKIGAEFCGPCPIHGGDGNNFYVNPNKRIWRCFSAGCDEQGDEGNDVIGFIRKVENLSFVQACERLGASDEWKPAPITQSAPPLPERVTSKPPADAPACSFNLRQLGDPSKVWRYLDTDGALLGYVTRYDTPQGKEIRQWTWGARGTQPAAWGCGHWNRPRPLYGLDKLAARPHPTPVMIVEGEKAADAAQALLPDYVVMTWPGGAQAWKHADFSPLRGRRVDFWPDNDEPGREAVQGIIAIVSAARGLDCHGKVIDPKGEAEGFDAADWAPERGDIKEWAGERIAWYREPGHPATAEPMAAPSGEGVGQGDDAPVGESPPLEVYANDAAPAKPAKKPRTKPRLAAVDGNLARAPDPDAEPMPASLSEDALAEHFVQEHGEEWRYCTEWGLWLHWRGDGWHRDKRNEVSDVCKVITRQALDWSEAAALPIASKQRINSKRTAWNTRDLVAADRRISILADELDRDPFMLGVPGGVVDLKTGKVLTAEPTQYITRRCSVAPAKGPHPLFDRVLDRACAGHDGMREYLIRWFGYMLTGDVREEAFMFLHGPGGSGKSTLIKAITEIMGDYALTISMDAFTESKQQRHSQEIAKIEGARLVYASETEEGRSWKESLIKWLTGGDKIVAHRMRMDDREFKPTHKLLIYGNSVPHLKNVGEEMRRRIHLVEYAGSLTQEERDPTLKLRLVEEYPAVLHTLIQGCVEWQDCASLGKPESVSDSVDKYLEGEDTLGQFIDDEITRSPESRELSGEVYRRYKSWCEKNGAGWKSQKGLVQALELRGFRAKKTNGTRYIFDLRLNARDPGENANRYGDDR